MFTHEQSLILRGMADLLLSEGAFAFRPDVLTLSHHHEVLCPPLLLVASAGVWVQLGPLFNELFPVGSSRLQNQTHHLSCSSCDTRVHLFKR